MQLWQGTIAELEADLLLKQEAVADAETKYQEVAQNTQEVLAVQVVQAFAVAEQAKVDAAAQAEVVPRVIQEAEAEMEALELQAELDKQLALARGAADEAMAAQARLQRAAVGDAAGLENRHLIAEPDDVLDLVGYQHHVAAQAPGERLQLGIEAVPAVVVERGKRLIQQQQAWPAQ